MSFLLTSRPCVCVCVCGHISLTMSFEFAERASASSFQSLVLDKCIFGYSLHSTRCTTLQSQKPAKGVMAQLDIYFASS